MCRRAAPAALLCAALACLSWLFPASAVRAGAPTRSCESVRYRVLELPFSPSVISPSGEVAGTNEVHQAVVWKRNTGVRTLRVPTGFHFTDPVAITESGAVVVNALDAQARRHQAFVYSTDSVVQLAGNQTLAHGIGSSGVIVGEWLPEGKTASDAVYWNDNVPRSIGLCCGGSVKAVNKSGDTIGDAYDAQGRFHAFVWNSSNGQHTIGPPDRYSSAVALDDSGRVLLQVGREAYLYDAGHLERLDLSPTFYNRPQAMNDCDVVVGGYGPNSDHYRAFLWNKTAGFQDLNTLIPAGSGWTLQSATAINDRGEIVGRGELNGADRGFLLVPKRFDCFGSTNNLR
jgi:hypothetical protein